MLDLLTLEDSMGRPTPTAALSDSRHVVALAAGQAKAVPVPQGARRVFVNATADVWVQYGAAATLPTGDVLDGTAPELNPATRIVAGIASLGLVAPADCMVSLVFYG